MSSITDTVAYYMHIIYLYESDRIPECLLAIKSIAPSGTYTLNPIAQHGRMEFVLSQAGKQYMHAKETRPSGQSKPLDRKVIHEHKQLEALEACYEKYFNMRGSDQELLLNYGRHRGKRGHVVSKKAKNRIMELLQQIKKPIDAVIASPDSPKIVA